MKYGTLFSGIGAPEQAFKDFGWEHQFMAEIEKFPSAVLKYHFPNIPNLGDVTKVDWDEIRRTRPVDLLVFGSPCQSFSIAGKRAGLDDPRGNLAIYALSVVNKLRPSCFLFENVPGLLSSDGGRDFGIFLKTVGECGYGCAWRILDAQYFGVPQRRRRVFVVGYLGDWRRAVQVLFERESLSGNPAPGRKTGQGFTHDVSPNIGASGRGFDRAGETRGQDPAVAISNSLNASASAKYDPTFETYVTHQLQGRHDSSEDGTGRGVPLVVTPIAFTQNQAGDVLTGDKIGSMGTNQNATGRNTPMVVLPINTQIATRSEAMGEGAGFGIGEKDDPAFTIQANHAHAVSIHQNQRAEVTTSETAGSLNTGGGKPAQPHSRVRRLTPAECEKLQGFQPGYTLISYRGKPAADDPRYKALGNSMAVPVVRWIGERIQKVMEIK